MRHVRKKCERAASFSARGYSRYSSHGNFVLGVILDNFYVSRHFWQNTYCHPVPFFSLSLPSAALERALLATRSFHRSLVFTYWVMKNISFY